MTITLADVEAARRTIAGHVMRTPMLPAPKLSALTRATVHVKYENLQVTNSFKERGALNKLASLTPAQRAKGVIACSAGNHAQGVAYHANRLDIPAVIVMPRYTPGVKGDETQRHGAEVILEGDNFDAAKDFAMTAAVERGLTLVHPYNDEKIIAGQGTTGLEMMKEHPELDAMIVAIGGGGLISGISIAAKSIKPPIEVFGVEMV